MKLGIVLFNKGPLASAENMASMAIRSEALGFDHVVVTEHLVVPRRQGEQDQYRSAKPSQQALGAQQRRGWEALRNYHEPLTTLMFLAGRTQHIRLGTSVMIAPYRNPLVSAKMLATMDVLARGRIFCGVGSGWWRDEFEALGLSDHFTTRGSRTDEYLRIYRALWEQDPVSYRGRFHQFENLEFSPKPLQQPLPIWVGGNSERALRRAAELGDCWHPLALKRPGQLEPERLPEMRRLLDRIAMEAGRDPARVTIAPRCNARIGPGESSLADTTAKLTEVAHRFACNGADSLTLDLPGGTWQEAMDHLDAIAQRVLPRLR
ncbi:MAG: TIGR03619 family F420-dependent LLM class oxidoreductase [Burkholderiales bacterium]|nr:TIGR03619 family F420-dependent LLM class oxidoreductase [Burkholderiales bacterium]